MRTGPTAGHCVVIGLQSTGETGLKHALERLSNEPGGGKMSSTLISGAQEGLVRYLQDHFPTITAYVAPHIKSLDEIDHLDKAVCFISQKLARREASDDDF